MRIIEIVLINLLDYRKVIKVVLKSIKIVG